MAMTGAARTISTLLNRRVLLTRKILCQSECYNKKLVNQKATAANLASAYEEESVPDKKQVPDLPPDPAFKNIDLNFENAEEAYKSKYTYELFRALFVFNLCSIKPLVDYNKEVSKCRHDSGLELEHAAHLNSCHNHIFPRIA